MFTEIEINYMMHELGLEFDFNNLSCDDWVKLEDAVAKRLEIKGFDGDYKPTLDGRICEGIIDKIP